MLKFDETYELKNYDKVVLPLRIRRVSLGENVGAITSMLFNFSLIREDENNIDMQFVGAATELARIAVDTLEVELTLPRLALGWLILTQNKTAYDAYDFVISHTDPIFNSIENQTNRALDSRFSRSDIISEEQSNYIKTAVIHKLNAAYTAYKNEIKDLLNTLAEIVEGNISPPPKPPEENTFNIDAKTTATMDEAKSDPTQNFMTGQVVSMKDLDVETANVILESIENDPALVEAKKNNLLEGGFSLDSVKTLSSVTTSGEKMSFEETMSIIEKEKAILDDLEKTYYAYGGYDQRYAYRGYFIGSYMDEANATRSTASMTMEATTNTIAAVGATAGLATSALNAIPLIPVIAEQAISYIFECTLGYAMTFTQSIAEIVLDVPSYLVDRTAYWTTEYIKDQSELLSELTGDFDQLVDLEKQKADLALSAAIEKIAGDKIKVQSYNWNNKVKNWTETVTNIQEIIDRGPDAVQEILREQMGNLLHDIYDEAGKAHEEVRSEIYGNVDVGAEATGKWTAHKINVSAEFILKNTLDAVREEKENAALEVANMQYKAITQMRARLSVPLPPESDEPSVTTPDS